MVGVSQADYENWSQCQMCDRKGGYVLERRVVLHTHTSKCEPILGRIVECTAVSMLRDSVKRQLLKYWLQNYGKRTVGSKSV